MLGELFAKTVLNLAEEVINQQTNSICYAADIIYPSLRDGGLLHVFGCGHSHILSEECFYRAGGLVPINPIFETSTMLHEGAVKSSKIEKMSGYAELIMDNYSFKSQEALLIFSNSGINSLPIEMAQQAKIRGLNVIAFTSQCYAGAKSRDKSGKRLPDFADLVIDTHIPYGDALIHVEKAGIMAVPGSTVINSILLNMLIAELIERYEVDNLSPPVFVSGNVEGGYEKNILKINTYKNRIKAL